MAALSFVRAGAFLILSVSPLFSGTSFAASVHEWRDRSIYQVVTDRYAHANGSTPGDCHVELGLYCGGTWRGIQDNLDYIQGMGFDSIWISPIVTQLPQETGDGEAYTAYWQQDLYGLNDRFGTEQDLRDLITELHHRGMLLMLDVVVNHFGYAGPGWMLDYSIFNPFNDPKYFHQFSTISNPINQTDNEVGWLGDSLVSLADLRTEDPEVQQIYGDWIHEIVSNYSIDGLRIDTCMNVNPTFFPGFVEAAGVFATGEVMQGDNSIVCQWEETVGSILNYPIYYVLTRAFQSPEGSIDDLVETIESTKQNCQDPTVMGSFSENHDVPRFANYTEDMSLAKNIITYTIMADGIPIIYQGQEQHMNGDISPYMNRAPLWMTGYDTGAPLYQHISKLNALRHHVIETSVNYTLYNNYAIYQDFHNLVLRKGFDGGQVITVLNNNGFDSADFNLPISNHGYPGGTQLTDVLDCTNLTVNATGWINTPMSQGKPRVLYPTDSLYNSSLCEISDQTPQGVPKPAQTTISTLYSVIASPLPTQHPSYSQPWAPPIPTQSYPAMGVPHLPLPLPPLGAGGA